MFSLVADLSQSLSEQQELDLKRRWWVSNLPKYSERFTLHATLSISTLRTTILITVVLNSWSDNFNIPVICASDAWLVSWNCVFCFLVHLVIFSWQPDLLCWVKGTAINRSLVMWWWGMRKGEAFCCSVFKSQCSVILCLWAVNCTGVSQACFFSPLARHRRARLGWNWVEADLVSLHFALLCFTGVAFFSKLKAQPSTSRNILMALFIIALLWWSWSEPTVSLGYACVFLPVGQLGFS